MLYSQANIRKVLIATDLESPFEDKDYKKWLADSHATVLYQEKCLEGIICLVHFEPGRLEVLTPDSSDLLQQDSQPSLPAPEI